MLKTEKKIKPKVKIIFFKNVLPFTWWGLHSQEGWVGASYGLTASSFLVFIYRPSLESLSLQLADQKEGSCM